MNPTVVARVLALLLLFINLIFNLYYKLFNIFFLNFPTVLIIKSLHILFNIKKFLPKSTLILFFINSLMSFPKANNSLAFQHRVDWG